MHLTLGILRTSQAVFRALSFFWLDGFAVPAPAQVPTRASRKLLGVSLQLEVLINIKVNFYRSEFVYARERRFQ